MNQTKKIMLILAIIFGFGEIAYDIYDIVRYFKLEEQYRSPVFYAVYMFLELFAIIAVVVLLIVSIWGNGKYFRSRYSLYMSSIIVSIVINFFSLTTLFLLISMFMSDWVWIKPEKEKEAAPNVYVVPASREEKIAALREKKEKGEISEEEFQAELTKLL